MCLAPAADPRHFTVADRITASLSDGVTDLDALTRAARAALPDHQAPTRDSAGLEWIGPKAFQARYGDVAGDRPRLRDALGREPGHPDLPAPPLGRTSGAAVRLQRHLGRVRRPPPVHRRRRGREPRSRRRSPRIRGCRPSSSPCSSTATTRPGRSTQPRAPRWECSHDPQRAGGCGCGPGPAPDRGRHRRRRRRAAPFRPWLPGVLPLPRRLHRVPVRGRGGGPVPLLRLRRRRRRHRLHRPASPRRVP